MTETRGFSRVGFRPPSFRKRGVGTPYMEPAVAFPDLPSALGSISDKKKAVRCIRTAGKIQVKKRFRKTAATERGLTVKRQRLPELPKLFPPGIVPGKQETHLPKQAEKTAAPAKAAGSRPTRRGRMD